MVFLRLVVAVVVFLRLVVVGVGVFLRRMVAAVVVYRSQRLLSFRLV